MAEAIDLGSVLLGLGLNVLATIVVYLFLPESIREPLRSGFLRMRKFVKNPQMEIKLTRRLGLREPQDADSVRSAVCTALREGRVYNADSLLKSLDFPLSSGSFKGRGAVSVTYDPDVAPGLTASVVLTLATDTRYRSLRATLENLRSAEDTIKRALQERISFKESAPQVTIKLESEFPMSAFFKAVQPLVLACSTSDGRIDFDYSPGQLTARGSLDADMIQWLRGAVAAL